VQVSKKYLKKVMFKVMELAQAQFAIHMKEAKIGALMYDGWSKDSMH
jgi:hypothetical protein